MTAPKNQPKAPTAKPVAKAAVPVIDYSKLTASDATMPKGTRGSVLDGTPFVSWMTDSKANETAKSVTVPANALTQTVYLIRQAAARINAGVRIVVKDDGANRVVTFQAKAKRAKLTPEQRAEREAAKQAKRDAKAAKAKAAK